MSKPACSNPRLKPPAPEKRSTPIGRCEFAVFSLFKKPLDFFRDFLEIFQFALPHHQDSPTHPFQLAANAAVASHVPFEFGHPKVDARLWRRGVPTLRMTVPKASVNQDDLSPTGKHEIGTSRQTFGVQSVAIAQPIHKPTDCEFWGGIF